MIAGSGGVVGLVGVGCGWWQAEPGDPAGAALCEDIGELGLFVGSNHGGDGGAGGVVKVVVDELADVPTGAAAEDDDTGGKGEEEAIGEGDGFTEVVPAIRGSTGEKRGDEQL